MRVHTNTRTAASPYPPTDLPTRAQHIPTHTSVLSNLSCLSGSSEPAGWMKPWFLNGRYTHTHTDTGTHTHTHTDKYRRDRQIHPHPPMHTYSTHPNTHLCALKPQLPVRVFGSRGLDEAVVLERQVLGHLNVVCVCVCVCVCGVCVCVCVRVRAGVWVWVWVCVRIWGWCRGSVFFLCAHV